MQINKHGSFYIRNGWPTKIIDAVNKEPFVFSPNNELAAVDEIGVGRVMVKAMRYWAVVMGLSEETKTQQGVSHTLSPLGELVSRYDPYCLDIGTLWLLHRNLACNANNATAWYWAFNEFGTKLFTKETFSLNFQTYLQKNGEKYAKAAVEKEFDCFKNTYVSDETYDFEKIINEDTVPFFAPLKLIRYVGDGHFEMKKSSIKDIPLNIILFCILSDNSKHLDESTQVSIDTLLEDKCQIGKYMNLSYATLLEALQQLENNSYISLFNNFGSRYIQVKQNDPTTILLNYFKNISR